MIESIEEFNKRRADRKMELIEYKIVNSETGEKIFIQGISLNTCFVHWNVDNSNILKSYKLEGKC